METSAAQALGQLLQMRLGYRLISQVGKLGQEVTRRCQLVSLRLLSMRDRIWGM